MFANNHLVCSLFFGQFWFRFFPTLNEYNIWDRKFFLFKVSNMFRLWNIIIIDIYNVFGHGSSIILFLCVRIECNIIIGTDVIILMMMIMVMMRKNVVMICCNQIFFFCIRIKNVFFSYVKFARMNWMKFLHWKYLSYQIIK